MLFSFRCFHYVLDLREVSKCDKIIIIVIIIGQVHSHVDGEGGGGVGVGGVTTTR